MALGVILVKRVREWNFFSLPAVIQGLRSGGERRWKLLDVTPSYLKYIRPIDNLHLVWVGT